MQNLFETLQLCEEIVATRDVAAFERRRFFERPFVLVTCLPEALSGAPFPAHLRHVQPTLPTRYRPARRRVEDVAWYCCAAPAGGFSISEEELPPETGDVVATVARVLETYHAPRIVRTCRLLVVALLSANLQSFPQPLPQTPTFCASAPDAEDVAAFLRGVAAHLSLPFAAALSQTEAEARAAVAVARAVTHFHRTRYIPALLERVDAWAASAARTSRCPLEGLDGRAWAELEKQRLVLRGGSEEGTPDVAAFLFFRALLSQQIDEWSTDEGSAASLFAEEDDSRMYTSIASAVLDMAPASGGFAVLARDMFLRAFVSKNPRLTASLCERIAEKVQKPQPCAPLPAPRTLAVLDAVASTLGALPRRRLWPVALPIRAEEGGRCPRRRMRHPLREGSEAPAISFRNGGMRVALPRPIATLPPLGVLRIAAGGVAMELWALCGDWSEVVRDGEVPTFWLCRGSEDLVALVSALREGGEEGEVYVAIVSDVRLMGSWELPHTRRLRAIVVHDLPEAWSAECAWAMCRDRCDHFVLSAVRVMAEHVVQYAGSDERRIRATCAMSQLRSAARLFRTNTLAEARAAAVSALSATAEGGGGGVALSRAAGSTQVLRTLSDPDLWRAATPALRHGALGRVVRVCTSPAVYYVPSRSERWCRAVRMGDGSDPAWRALPFYLMSTGGWEAFAPPARVVASGPGFVPQLSAVPAEHFEAVPSFSAV